MRSVCQSVYVDGDLHNQGQTFGLFFFFGYYNYNNDNNYNSWASRTWRVLLEVR
jgi:hypothetical protein